MSARILYAEDDLNLGYVTHDHLTRHGYAVTHCTDGANALAAFLARPFDLCLLDVVLPSLDGYALARHLRAHDPHVPILLLTARSLPEDRLTGLRLGADDYITKPYGMEELTLRTEVFLRRRPPYTPLSAPTYWLGNYRFDYPNLQLTYGHQTQTLTLKEGQLLQLFCQHPGQLLRRETILTQLWGEDDYFMGRSLDVFVSRLRKHLRHDPAVRLDNVPRVGFLLRQPAPPANPTPGVPIR